MSELKGQIWFLTGSQDLYGEETLKQVAQQSQAVADGIAVKLKAPVELVWKPVVKNSDAIRRQMLDAFRFPVASVDGNVLNPRV